MNIKQPTTIGDINPFRYRSYFYDTDTGLYYLNTRYYDPAVCRFISPDSVQNADPQSINGLNLYAYCGNNPVMKNQKSTFLGGAIICSSLIYGNVSGEMLKPVLVNQVTKTLSKSNRFNLFGHEWRVSTGFESSPYIAIGSFGRIGFSSYLTYTQGQEGIFYAFAGRTSDMLNLLGTTYYAGIGINLFDMIKTEIYLQTLGAGASINIGRFSLGAEINLIGGTSITLGWNTDLGNGKTKTEAFTIGVNTGFLFAIVAWIYSVITTGQTSPVPILP